MTKIKKLNENEDISSLGKAIISGIQEALNDISNDPRQIKTLKVAIPISSNCKECVFRLNETRAHWKCVATSSFRNTPKYIPYNCDAENDKPDFCPFNIKED